MGWHEKYLGKPWRAVPRPPENFNCGELVREALLERAGITYGVVCEDPNDLPARVRRFEAGLFGLRPLGEGEPRKELDCVFMAKSRYEDHCGIAVATSDGLLVMHCLQSLGVVLESPLEAMSHGFSRLNWYRHEDL